MFGNYRIFIAFALSMLVAQAIKYLVDKIKFKRLPDKIKQQITAVKKVKIRFFGEGGMPSSHSATASALVASIFLEEGMTTVFYVALCFAIIVIYDATHIRFEIGKHARNINEHLKTSLKERTGHTPLQAFLGIITGLCVTAITYLIL